MNLKSLSCGYKLVSSKQMGKYLKKLFVKISTFKGSNRNCTTKNSKLKNEGKLLNETIKMKPGGKTMKISCFKILS